MKPKILLLVATMVFADVALAQPPGVSPAKPSTPPVAASPDPAELPEGPGKSVVQTVCAQCHNIGVVIGQSHSREEWSDSVSRMIGNGAQLTDDEYTQVIDYLTKHYGPAVPKGPVNGN